jgi:hypothetical protein
MPFPKKHQGSSHAGTVGQVPEWLPEARRQIGDLLGLAPGWDSYSARQVSGEAVARAFALLEQHVQQDTPRPSIAPMSRGGIQLEWHLRKLNIEITVPSQGSPVEVWYEDLCDGSEHELVVGDDPGALRALLAELTLRR